MALTASEGAAQMAQPPATSPRKHQHQSPGQLLSSRPSLRRAQSPALRTVPSTITPTAWKLAGFCGSQPVPARPCAQMDGLLRPCAQPHQPDGRLRSLEVQAAPPATRSRLPSKQECHFILNLMGLMTRWYAIPGFSPPLSSLALGAEVGLTQHSPSLTRAVIG